MMGQTGKRPWIAALLAVVYPGLGHVYLRSWLRALMWFWMALLAVVLFVPESVFVGISNIGELLSALGALPIEARMALLMVMVFNVVDAYWQAMQEQQRVSGIRCPTCGRTIEDNLQLSFCHWCTSPLPVSQDSST